MSEKWEFSSPEHPNLAVEVIYLYTEMDEKVTDSLEAGTRMVVILNPRKRTVTVYRSLHQIAVLREQDCWMATMYCQGGSCRCCLRW